MKYKQKIGLVGENIASRYFLKNGYVIMARNMKISYQEIDIIARIKEKYVFIEVKTSTDNNLDQAEMAMNKKKLINIKKAISAYAGINKIDVDDCRLDLVAVYINNSEKIAKIKHYIEIL